MAEYRGRAHSVTWELTLGCNARCRHCASSAGRPRPNELTTEEALGLCDQLAGVGTRCVCLFGGEALLRPDWETIARRLAEHGIEPSVATNGLAVTEQVARRMVAAGVVGVSVSLDAATAGVHDELRGREGAWEHALRALSICTAIGLREISVITSVQRRNLGELDALAELLATRHPSVMWLVNVASCHDGSRFPHEARLEREGYLQLAEAVDRLRQAYRGTLEVTGSHDLGYFSARLLHLHNFEWQGCRAGLDTLGIRSDGLVKGCLILPDDHVEGSVREEPLAAIWRDGSRFALNRAFREELLQGACEGCLFGRVCRGGCSELAQSYTGSPYSYPFCLYREERDELAAG